MNWTGQKGLIAAGIAGVAILGAWGSTSTAKRGFLARAQTGGEVPQFEWDPTWPKQPFPNN